MLQALLPYAQAALTMTDHAFKSDFLKTLSERGYVHQITHPVELDA